jgi:pilus assembly protein Flp/PilA
MQHKAAFPLAKFTADRTAVTAIEYALIAALIAVVIVGSLTSLGVNISATFTTAADALKTNGCTTSSANTECATLSNSSQPGGTAGGVGSSAPVPISTSSTNPNIRSLP